MTEELRAVDATAGREAKAAGTAFGEDVVILARQQRSIDTAPAGWTSVDINADAGVLQARRVVDGLLAAEAGQSE